MLTSVTKSDFIIFLYRSSKKYKKLNEFAASNIRTILS